MFSLSMSISPGPVNMTILSTSLNHGFNKSLAFISGATIGFVILLSFFALSFSQVINQYPIIFKLLELFGSAFIIYVGCKIITSKPQLEIINNPSIPNFLDGFLLQWLNPKAWVACAAGITLFATPQSNTPVISFIMIYFFICYLSLALWGYLGEKLSSVLRHPKHIRVFNWVMGSSLILIATQTILHMLTTD